MTVETYPMCRFYVMIGNETQGVFTEVSGLQVELDVMDYREGGNNGFIHRFPSFTRAGNLSLKRGIVRKNDFYKWFKQIADGQLVSKNVSVVMYDVDGKPLMSWSFANAYPIKWIGPHFQASESVVAIETLELAHEGITLTPA
jgi:phage tail-like protein